MERAADLERDDLGRLVRVIGVCGYILWSDVGQQDEEFVPALAGDDVAGAGGGLKACSHGDQKLVAGGMAEAVVDELEVVEVDEEHGDGAALLGTAGDGRIQLFLEGDPVRQGGQRVVEGDVVELASCLFERVGGLPALGDVRDDAVHEQAAVRRPAGPHAIPDPANATVVATRRYSISAGWSSSRSTDAVL